MADPPTFTHHWLPLLGRALLQAPIYPPYACSPPPRSRRAALWHKHMTLAPSWNSVLASPPNLQGSLLLPSFLHNALAPGSSFLSSPRTAAGSSVPLHHSGSWNPVFLASLNPLPCSTWVGCQLMLVLRISIT